jgi:hypothetical protein
MTLPAELRCLRNWVATGLAKRFKRASMVSSCAVADGYTSSTERPGKDVTRLDVTPVTLLCG